MDVVETDWVMGPGRTGHRGNAGVGRARLEPNGTDDGARTRERDRYIHAHVHPLPAHTSGPLLGPKRHAYSICVLFRSRWMTRRVLSLLRRHTPAWTQHGIIHSRKDDLVGRRCRPRATPTLPCSSSDPESSIPRPHPEWGLSTSQELSGADINI